MGILTNTKRATLLERRTEEERPIKAGRRRCDSIHLFQESFPPTSSSLTHSLGAPRTRQIGAHGGGGDPQAPGARRRGGGHGAPDLCDVFCEAGCLAACRGHPSVVELRDVAADAATGDVFLVMEFVGPSLRDQLMRPCSEAETRAFMRQLLRGAERMHADRPPGRGGGLGLGRRSVDPGERLRSAIGDHLGSALGGGSVGRTAVGRRSAVARWGCSLRSEVGLMPVRIAGGGRGRY
ncbi:hypothetical protein ACP70R_045748 [Stipagrostis hirtigluma subsp. patula]